MENYIKHSKIFIMLIMLSIIQVSCKKFIEVDPPTSSINGGNVYEENSNAAAVLTGLYGKMASGTFSLDLSVYPDLSADNLALFDLNALTYKLYYQNSLSSSDGTQGVFWPNLYSYIYITNAAIEGLNQSTTLDTELKQRLLGEAHFSRGFCYFYLVNLFGEIPLVLSTDQKTNAVLAKTPINKVYEQIITDLQIAEKLLGDNYVDATILKEDVNRVRPNKFAASAVLARILLYTKKYEDAEIEATKVIEATSLYSTVDLDNVFLKNSLETIWALQPVSGQVNTKEGQFYIYDTGGPDVYHNVFLSENFLQNFENADKRKEKWIGYSPVGPINYAYPFKYKVQVGDPASATENTIVLRLGEQYLIRAEARALNNNLDGAKSDLNKIRNRAGLEDTQASNQEDIIAAILKERRVELFTEWGNRWLDLKRSGEIDGVMSEAAVSKGGTWNSYKALFPIPISDIKADPFLTQNEGYN